MPDNEPMYGSRIPFPPSGCSYSIGRFQAVAPSAEHGYLLTFIFGIDRVMRTVNTNLEMIEPLFLKVVFDCGFCRFIIGLAI